MKKNFQPEQKPSSEPQPIVLPSATDSAKPNVICSQSVYATFDQSNIDFPKEISRWKGVIENMKEGTDNYLENKERSIELIAVAKVNLEYLLSVFPVS